MNYPEPPRPWALVIAGTGAAFPFFSPLLGWLGVFLTGSDTAANALFGSLQVVTGKPPRVESRADGRGQFRRRRRRQDDQPAKHRRSRRATGMARSDEGKLFRFTLRHSVFLAIVIGLLTLFYAYVHPPGLSKRSGKCSGCEA